MSCRGPLGRVHQPAPRTDHTQSRIILSVPRSTIFFLPGRRKHRDSGSKRRPHGGKRPRHAAAVLCCSSQSEAERTASANRITITVPSAGHIANLLLRRPRPCPSTTQCDCGTSETIKNSISSHTPHAALFRAAFHRSPLPHKGHS